MAYGNNNTMINKVSKGSNNNNLWINDSRQTLQGQVISFRVVRQLWMDR